MKTTDLTVAKTILSQLGGQKFITMTGSKNFSGDENSLSMHLTRNKIHAQFLTIKLNGLDLYEMTFSKLEKVGVTQKIVVVKEVNMVYDDMLQDIFTSVTGLYTHL